MNQKKKLIKSNFNYILFILIFYNKLNNITYLYYNHETKKYKIYYKLYYKNIFKIKQKYNL